MTRQLSPVIPQHSILADERDDAQDRGEVQKQGGGQSSKAEFPTAADIGLTRKDIHEARVIRDAKEADSA